MALIKLLPPELSDKIAAGEVVERPASVVKELVENSIDAGADRIGVEIAEGGLKSILVRDNGIGLTPDQARLALKRHATSKISLETDLFNIRTMGFRGEALPAIASVSRLTLTTRPTGAPAAFRLIIEGGVEQSGEEIGGPPGTTIRIDDLFFNTPARKKFMKTERTETAWVKEAIIRLALARPDIRFELTADGRPMLDLPPTDSLKPRLTALFGRAETERLIEIHHAHPAAIVSGFIAPPDRGKAGAKSVYAFVNGRFIRDKVVLAGLSAGFQGRLDRGRYPLSVVLLDLEPATVDINVHPAKLEVRFHHSQAVHQALRRAVSQALGAEERSVFRRDDQSPPPSFAAPTQTPGLAEPRAAYSSTPAGPDRFNFTRPVAPPGPRPVSASPPEPRTDRTTAPRPDQDGTWSRFRYLGLYGGVYLVGQVGDDLVLIDQHAAHERIIFNRLRADKAEAQPLLTPERIDLPPQAAESLEAGLADLARLGLELEPFGPDGRTFLIKSVPAVVGGVDPVALVTGLAEDLVEGGHRSDTGPAAALARRACHSAIRGGQELNPAEVDRLIDQLAQLDGPLTCPHGRPIIRRLTRAEIDTGFKRR